MGARQFGRQGLLAAHVIIDGGSDAEQLDLRSPQHKEQKGEDGMLRPEAIADVDWALHVQDCTAWSLELDPPPYQEPF